MNIAGTVKGLAEARLTAIRNGGDAAGDVYRPEKITAAPEYFTGRSEKLLDPVNENRGKQRTDVDFGWKSHNHGSWHAS